MNLIGSIIGTLGLVLGSFALSKIIQLENHLKKTGMLDKNYKSH